MAASGNVTISGNVSNAPQGAETFGPFTFLTAAAVANNVTQTLTGGANTVTIPTGTTCLILAGPNRTNPTPNPTVGATLTVKGIAGDTGIVFGSSGLVVFTWDAANPAPATVIVNASIGCTLFVWSM